MRKNKSLYCLVLMVVAMVVFSPLLTALPQAQSVTDAAGMEEEEEKEPIRMDLVTPDAITWELYKTTPFILKLLVIIILSAAAKVFLLKIKLKIPGKLPSMEKLISSSLALTIIESHFMVLVLAMFSQMSSSLITKIITINIAERMGLFAQTALQAVFITPYICVIGGLLTLILIKVNTELPIAKLKSYYFYSMLVAAMTPAAYIILNFIIALLFENTVPA